MSQIVDIFIQPSNVFLKLRENPGFALPLAIVMLLTSGLTLCYFLKVDPAWYANYALLASGADISAAEIVKAKQMMPATRTMGLVGAPMAAIALILVTMIYALYFMLAGRVVGIPLSFRHGMSLTCWSNMPVLLGVLVAIAGVALMTPQTGLESLMLTNMDPLLVQLPASSPWSGLARSFNLLNLWVTFLMALGWRLWAKCGWKQAAIVAVIPFVVVYGGMAAWALAKQ